MQALRKSSDTLWGVKLNIFSYRGHEDFDQSPEALAGPRRPEAQSSTSRKKLNWVSGSLPTEEPHHLEH